jgi:hypothetical protein
VVRLHHRDDPAVRHLLLLLLALFSLSSALKVLTARLALRRREDPRNIGQKPAHIVQSY